MNLAASDAGTAGNIRSVIFNEYWAENKDVDVKRQSISSCVEMKPIVRSRPRDGTKGKSNSLTYNFFISNQRIKVCKVMFLNTLSISNKVVINALKKRRRRGIIKSDLRGKHWPINKTSQEVIDLVNETKFNLSFKLPGTDTCDTCNAFIAQLKNDKSDEEKEKISDDYNIHLQEAQWRYNMKHSDTAFAKANCNHKVVIADLQKCLPILHLMNCVSFYKRKLSTIDFTMYDSSDGSAACIMWDESKAARKGNEIASSLLKWADQIIPNSTLTEIKLWTDNCYGQNKYMAIIMCLFWILNKLNQIKVINQNFLLKEHTHMEADSVHASIEKKRKKAKELTILTPWDWQQLIRQSSTKYEVFNKELKDFKNFKSLYDKPTTSPFVYKKNRY